MQADRREGNEELSRRAGGIEIRNLRIIVESIRRGEAHGYERDDYQKTAAGHLR